METTFENATDVVGGSKENFYLLCVLLSRSNVSY